MTQKAIVRNTLRNRRSDIRQARVAISTYGLAQEVEQQTGSRPAESTLRRVIRDLRAEGLDIRTSDNGYRLAL